MVNWTQIHPEHEVYATIVAGYLCKLSRLFVNMYEEGYVFNLESPFRVTSFEMRGRYSKEELFKKATEELKKQNIHLRDAILKEE